MIYVYTCFTKTDECIESWQSEPQVSILNRSNRMHKAYNPDIRIGLLHMICIVSMVNLGSMPTMVYGWHQSY